MSYHPGGQQGYPYQNPQQNQGYPPQQPQGNAPYQTYGAPPHQPNAQYQHPPQGFPPQGQYQQPPQGFPPQGFPPQGQGQYQQPPGNYGGYPTQQGYGAPDQSHYPQQQQQQQQQQQHPTYPPTQASPGYNPNIQTHGNMGPDADQLRKAMRGAGTDEKTLIRILSKPDPLQMALLRETYQRNLQRSLKKDVQSETSGHFRDTLLSLIAGPLMQDVYNVFDAVNQPGTNEAMLNDVLLNRSNADMDAIKAAYLAENKRSLEADVAADLSGRTNQLFKMILSKRRPEESAPISERELDDNVDRLHRATGSKNPDTVELCATLTGLSNGQIRAVAHHFEHRYQVSLEKAIKDRTRGHIEDALVLLVNRAVDPVMADAVQLEEAMAGIGTKDTLLLNRIVRIHWDRAHKDQVKRAYMARYKKDLITRVKGETSKNYEKILVACLE